MCERVRVLAHTIASLLVIPSAEKIALDLEARGDVTTSPHDAEEDNDNPTSSSSSSTASLLRLSRGMRGLIDTSAAFSRRRFADVTDERRRPTSVVKNRLLLLPFLFFYENHHSILRELDLSSGYIRYTRGVGKERSSLLGWMSQIGI